MADCSEDVLDGFHPAVAEWFRGTYAGPTDCQREAWAAIKQGRHTLIAAPTGSGKTLAAFLAAIDDLAREGEVFGLPDETRVLYVSPLKALSNDVHRNLEAPLDGVNRRLFETGSLPVAIRASVRTGDTPAVMRAAMVRQPPHILVTTPESLYILLTSDSGRRMLRTVRTAIIDEIHAVVATKRGAHLALSLERLRQLIGQPLTRIGLSATQKPIEEIARFLTGANEECVLIDRGHRRAMDLGIELPQLPLEAVLSHEAASQIYDRMAELIQSHRTTLVFVNTRRLAERVAHALTERLGDRQVTSHHGSLSREQRLAAEDRLKKGKLRALVATASLELGIDVGDIDLVCQLGSTGSIATFVQRVGRSGHAIAGLPKGRLFPTTRDDLLECIALIRATRQGDLDRLSASSKPLDVLAQHLVAMVSAEDWCEEQLYRCVIRAYPFRDLSRSEYDEVVRMLTEGYATQRGMRGAYLHRDGINRRLRARRGARLTAVTCGGAIPDNAEYRVVLEPGPEILGAVDEHFAIESVVGDVFQLGNTSWRVLGLDGVTLRVADAGGQPPSIPFWFGEAPGRCHELSESLSELRRDLADALDHTGLPGARDTLLIDPAFPQAAVDQAVNYTAAAKAALGLMPTLDCIVFERFFDESGGMQFIIHAPFGSRVNRAWGLALRKRFCRTFNFELQAAATEDALILSLGTSQSFALEDVRHFLKPNTARDLLVQALLDAPMFTVRWRWNAVCSLAVRRFQGGRKTPPHLLRMQAEDLVTSVFPAQLACLENIIGDREIPDHPLVRQTIEDCLTEAMDIDRFIAVLAGLESGAVQVVCRDLAEPSPLAAEIVNARVYSFLDGAPLEERRTRAVKLRRGFEPRPGGDLDSVDAAAVARVRREIRPEAANVEEFHDALQLSGFLLEEEGRAADWLPYFDELARQRRATRLILNAEAAFWIAAERWPLVRSVYPGLRAEPPLSLPADLDSQAWNRDDALVSLLRARLAIAGPVNELSLATQMMISPLEVRTALCRLETEGFVLRGRYTPDDDWCERGLVARIQRYARDRRRCAIEPVTAADYVDFLVRWQHVHPETRMQGAQGLGAILTQLEGFEGPAFSWESAILPARVENYADTDLDRLCQCGQFSWLRLRAGSGTRGPVRTTPIVFVPRRSVARWCSSAPLAASEMPSASAQTLQRILADGGALFFDELVERSGLPPVAAERALAELVAIGTVTSDAFAGLRALLVPESMKQRYKGLGWGLDQAGRWSLLTTRLQEGIDRAPEETEEHAARVLLRRYGVMFRGLLMRETCAPPWQSLVRIYRRLEARGEIRGGRFVAGPFGEQYALAEALEPLRSVRGQSPDADIWISAADPLNLTGIVSEGVRIASASGRWILYRRGEPVAVDNGEGRISALHPREASAIANADRFPRRSPLRTPRAHFRRSP